MSQINKKVTGRFILKDKAILLKELFPGLHHQYTADKKDVYVVTRLSRAVVTYNLKSVGACHILLATASSAAHVTTVVKTSKSRFA